MARQDNGRRQLAAQVKSAIVSAAIVGTIGGWVAFGTQAAADTAAVAQVASADTTVAEAAVVDTAAASADTATSSVSTAASAASAAQPAQSAPVTMTRSSR